MPKENLEEEIKQFEDQLTKLKIEFQEWLDRKQELELAFRAQINQVQQTIVGLKNLI